MHVNAAHEHDNALEQKERLLRAVLNSISDPLLVFDDQWRLVLANPPGEALFNTREQVGKSIDQVVNSESLTGFARGQHPLAEWVFNDRTFTPSLLSIAGDNAQATGWVLSLRDISQYKRLNRNQNEFIHIVAHDLRSPLTYMQGFASMIGMVGELNERQRHFVDKVLTGISQIAALVDNISDAGRFDVETGFYEMSRAYCDMHEMVRRVVDNHLIPDDKQELTISVDVEDDVPIINVDTNMIERALTNLYDNAIKYTPNGGEIDVRAYCQDEHVIISVADNGLGISDEEQKQLFQRHVRLTREEYRKIKGSGLGLFIVRSVAQRHGGDAWVKSAPDEGSTFYFSIPLRGENLVVNSQPPQD